jgi:hypothetical protein
VVAQTRSISPGRKPGKTNSRLPAGDFLADRRFLVFFTSRIDCAQQGQGVFRVEWILAYRLLARGVK